MYIMAEDLHIYALTRVFDTQCEATTFLGNHLARGWTISCVQLVFSDTTLTLLWSTTLTVTVTEALASCLQSSPYLPPRQQLIYL